jgi:hypothetical protein
MSHMILVPKPQQIHQLCRQPLTGKIYRMLTKFLPNLGKNRLTLNSGCFTNTHHLSLIFLGDFPAFVSNHFCYHWSPFSFNDDNIPRHLFMSYGWLWLGFKARARQICGFVDISLPLPLYTIFSRRFSSQFFEYFFVYIVNFRFFPFPYISDSPFTFFKFFGKIAHIKNSIKNL